MAQTTSRRTSPRGVRRSLAAVGVAGVAGGAVALGLGAAAAPKADALVYPPGIWFDCTGQFGGTIPLGTWGAEISTTAPSHVEPGATIPDISVTAKVTASTVATDTLRNLENVTVEGTSDAPYKVFGNTYTAKLTIPVTDIPATGNLVTVAKGTAPGTTAPTTPKDYPITVDGFTATITATNKQGQKPVIPVTCVYRTDPIGTVNNKPNVIGSIAVGSPSTSTSTSTSTSSGPSTSTTSSSSSSSTSSSSSSSSSTSSSSSSTTESSSTSTGSSTATPPIVGFVALDKKSYAPGEPFKLVAGGFKPNETGISIVVRSTPVTVASGLTADAKGNLAYEGTMPTTLPAGIHTLTVEGSINPTVAFTLVSAPVITPSTVQTGSVAAPSGDNNLLTTAGIGLSAVGVVAIGGAVVLGRKREQH